MDNGREPDRNELGPLEFFVFAELRKPQSCGRARGAILCSLAGQLSIASASGCARTARRVSSSVPSRPSDAKPKDWRVHMDSFTLLADPSEPKRLRTDDRHFEVRVRVYDESGPEAGTYLQLQTSMDGFGFFHVLVDSDGGVYAMTRGETDEEARVRLLEHLDHEQRFRFQARGYDLLAEESNGQRVSVLRSDDGRLAVRAKAYLPGDDEEESFVRLRASVRDFGDIHMVVSDWGRIVATVSGRSDSDADNRLRGELRRKGIELDN